MDTLLRRPCHPQPCQTPSAGAADGRSSRACQPPRSGALHEARPAALAERRTCSRPSTETDDRGSSDGALGIVAEGGDLPLPRAGNPTLYRRVKGRLSKIFQV